MKICFILSIVLEPGDMIGDMIQPAHAKNSNPPGKSVYI